MAEQRRDISGNNSGKQEEDEEQRPFPGRLIQQKVIKLSLIRASEVQKV